MRKPIYTAKLMNGVRNDLKPALSLWAFGGVRKEELSRLTWEEEIKPGLASGFIHIAASKAKTGTSRNVPVNSTLRSWLSAQNRISGVTCKQSVLPSGSQDYRIEPTTPPCPTGG